METVSEIQATVRAMAARGLDVEAIDRIAIRNFMRVFAETQALPCGAA